MPDTPVSILLVNDDLLFSARILSVLKAQGYATDTAAAPDEALAKARATRPALVILNLGAPRLGGVELARRLKNEAGAERLLAFVSHVRIPELRAEAAAAGVDLLCANSAVVARLPELVERVLGDRTAKEHGEDEGLNG